MPDFALDPQLEKDSLAVTELPLSAVRLMLDANYTWLLLIPRRAGAVEIVDLDEPDRVELMWEIAAASRALKETVRCDKLNVAALGNIVPQLHVHVIARRRGDAAWPKPVWGAAPTAPYAKGEAQALAAKLAARLK